MAILYLTEDEVREVLSMDLALAAVESALRKLALDEAENRSRQRCQTDHVMLHVLPAAVRTLGAIGFKAYTTGRFPARFHVVLYDPKTGSMAALIEADYLGQMRTGAASGVATKKLARAEANTVGLFGTGKQARTQLLAVCSVRSIARVHVHGRDQERRERFASDLSRECGVEVIPVEQPEDAARGLDIVITATSSREPVLAGAWLAEGTHLNVVGSNFLSKSEIDVETIRRATLVTVDSKEQARLEAGDLVAALRDGVLHWEDVHELSQLLVGRYPGRQSPRDITLFKSLGLGVEDVAVASRVVELARQRGIGRELEL